jgi:hypothetical protein
MDPNQQEDDPVGQASNAFRRPHKPTGLTPLRARKPKAEKPD